MADPNERKVYIGDAVYAELNEIGQIVLTVENGIEITEEICLGPEVWAQLLEVVEMWKVGDHGR